MLVLKRLSTDLTPEELFELTGYKRGAEQCRWLKANGFKFRVTIAGQPRVNRAHFDSKMGAPVRTPGPNDGPNWAAIDVPKGKRKGP
ncbi:MAG: DUF4224 domain-containing protein [Pseudomonadota bacterium]